LSIDSVIAERWFDWQNACDAWGFEIDPEPTAESLTEVAPGVVEFSASSGAIVDGNTVNLRIDVEELWQEGPDPYENVSLERHGCHAAVIKWHLQVGDCGTAESAERLEVVPPDPNHLHIHRHPFGEPNYVKERNTLSVPDGWLAHLNRILGGAFEG